MLGGKGPRRPTHERTAPNAVETQEVLRCGKDPVYFANKYGKIQHPSRGTVSFKTYPFQDDCLRAFQRHAFNIVLKSRQLGLSTVTALYAAWLGMFRRDKNILVIAHKHSAAKNFVKKVKKFLDSLPPWMKLCNYEPTQNEIRFDNGSVITAVATTEDAGRSEALSLLIVDEAAIIKNLDEIWTSIFPTLSEGGSAIVMSTPKGVGGQYHDLWVQAEVNGFAADATGENGFHPIKLPWNVHPEHGQDYYDKMYAKLGPRRSAQELNCDFQASGETFIKPAAINWLSQEMKAPVSQEGPEYAVWVWRKPVPGRKYIFGADASRGDAADNSAFVGIDMTSGEVVVEYTGKVYPDRLAEVLDEYGRVYNNALLVVESNTYGNHTLSELKKLRYPNIFYRTAPKHSIENHYPSDKDKAGFDTNVVSRAEALTRLEDSIRCHVVTPRSSRFHAETMSFVWVNEKPQAKKGKTDDLIMASAIACWAYRGFFENYRLAFKGDGAAGARELPLFMYMKKSNQTLTSSPSRITISTDGGRRPMTQPPIAVEVGLEELRWLLK